jgi:hypothetical protein
VNHPTIYFERLLSGRWNWQDAIGDTSGVSGAASFNITDFQISGARVRWVENLPADSGGGLIQSARATIYLDDVTAALHNVTSVKDSAERPVTFSLEGRTADGRISIAGETRSFSTEAPANATRAVRAVALPSGSVVDREIAKLTAYLENVGAPALGQMVPLSSLAPTSGSLTGTITLVVHPNRLDCRTDVVLKNVAYRPNLASPAVRGRAVAVSHVLESYRANGHVIAACDGSFDNEQYRPIYAVQAALTEEALRTAPPLVRNVAAYDKKRVDGVGIQDALKSVAGATAYDMIDQATDKLIGSRQGDSNPVTRGAKGFGRGFKRLFSGKH